MQHGWNSIIIISDQSDFEICISMSHIHEALVKPTILSLEHIDSQLQHQKHHDPYARVSF
jgi:hypothetical protein